MSAWPNGLMNTGVWNTADVRRIGVRAAARYREMIELRNSCNLDILRGTEISQQSVSVERGDPNLHKLPLAAEARDLHIPVRFQFTLNAFHFGEIEPLAIVEVLGQGRAKSHIRGLMLGFQRRQHARVSMGQD